MEKLKDHCNNLLQGLRYSIEKVFLFIVSKYLAIEYQTFYKSIILWSVLFCSSSLAQVTDPWHPWKLAHQSDNVWVWNLIDKKQVVGTLQSQNRSKPIDWTQIKSKKFFSNLKRSKQKMLDLIGITHWTVRTSQWKKKSDHYELTLRGSYRNATGQLINFYEVHLFYTLKTHQILISHPQKVSIKRHLVGQFIARAKRMFSQ